MTSMSGDSRLVGEYVGAGDIVGYPTGAKVGVSCCTGLDVIHVDK